MKRFTETNKWRDPWFRLLSSTSKLLWGYLCDSCDNAGVAEMDLEAFSFFIGSNVGDEHLKELGTRIQILPSGKIWIPKFVKFQFGDLSGKNRVHLSVYALLCEHGLEHHFSLGEGNEFPRKRVTDHFRKEILGLDQYRCQWCGESFEDAMLVLDHVVPVIKGGSHSKDNVVACCIPCNARKKDTDPIEFSKGRNVLYRLSTILDRLSKDLYTLKEKEKDKDKEKYREGGTGGNVETKHHRFEKPSLETIKLQAAKIGLPDIEAEKFYAFYESKGWVVGKAQMKSWCGALSGWKLRWQESPHIPPVNGEQTPSLWEKETERLKRETGC